MTTRQCEMKRCTQRAGIGLQLILASDERRETTRWLCVRHMPEGLRQLADALDAAIASTVLVGLIDIAEQRSRDT